MDFKIAIVNWEELKKQKKQTNKQNQPLICFKDIKNPNYQLLAKCIYIYTYIHICIYRHTYTTTELTISINLAINIIEQIQMSPHYFKKYNYIHIINYYLQ